ncbi:MAG: diaminopimelate epimerase [Gaiellales bacterium]
MRFEKWHGIGNAYLVIERDEVTVELTPARVERICHPDMGAGSDGILVIDEDSRVGILNPDGSEAEFSGNGTRIAAGYLMRRDALDRVVMRTLKGEITGRLGGDVITIDAGRASLESAADHRPGGGDPPASSYTFVSVGNPHCVIEVDDPEALDLAAAGPPIERHPWFPNRTNVEFYRPLDEHEIRMRVWERGAGETLSSGSGSSAAAVAAVVNGRARSPVTVHLDGGDLVIDVSGDLEVSLTGPVERIHTGAFSPEFLRALERL